MDKRLPDELDLLIGTGVMISFLLLHWRKRKPPDFFEAINVMLATFISLAGVDVGRLALFAKPDDMGILSDHRKSLMIGAIAMIWVSVHRGIKPFYPVCTAKRDEPPQESTQ